jgi:CRISPR-associated protein Cas1
VFPDDFLSQRYPEIKFDVSDGLTRLRDVKSVREILGVEGILAGKYRIEFSKAVPKEYDFCNRIDQFRRVMGSGDMVNICSTMAILCLRLNASETLIL